ncbi:MAG: hypothetical protein BWZ10_02452 [candidate division BRC1 bacterium ADurb.BinA364]|nr:MAG: hypothetical protein BWZ10_02452 [candidate division BRC1 bacterium ADurb.BinA364]
MRQTALRVLPTATRAEFESETVRIALEFITPALPGDLDILSRPATYLRWTVESRDGQSHEAQIYFEASPLLAVHEPGQIVQAEFASSAAGLSIGRIGTVEQPVLARKGDDTRIDWGYAYLAAGQDADAVAIAGGAEARAHFLECGQAPSAQPCEPRPASQAPALILAMDLGLVGGAPASRLATLAYDDLFSIRYFDSDLRPYWRRGGLDSIGMLERAAAEAGELAARCAAFDAELMEDMRAVGGERYAALCALAYRQAFGGSKLAAGPDGRPLYFPKENHSNGCMATVDVFYPMAPQCLLLSPALARALVVPVLDYALSPRWKFPYAPHDLGRYPHATGQVYGGGEETEERQMPVEESANMLLLAAAIARAEGDASLAAGYWPLLKQWAAYLEEKGFDPENQLCTDDFAGHLAHNVNLSAKTIVALGAFAQLCEALGEAREAARYAAMAGEFALRWVEEAGDGDHFRLAFDKPGSWSQKYNLVWDRILGLGLFPAAAIEQEIAFYKSAQLRYGLPLDSRETYTKLDWIVWTAAISGKRADLDAFVGPVADFLNETPDRFPMTDWYFADSGKRRGFTARPVVGGVFMPALGNEALWRKWTARAGQ